MEALRDANRVTTGLGVSSSDSTVTIPFQIDSVTGYVLLDLTVVADAGGVLSDENAARDGNHVPVMIGTKSDDSGIAAPAIDNRNGNLYFDIAFS